MKVLLVNDKGEIVEAEATINGLDELPDTPLMRAITTAEWDLIARYDRGEFG